MKTPQEVADSMARVDTMYDRSEVRKFIAAAIQERDDEHAAREKELWDRLDAVMKERDEFRDKGYAFEEWQGREATREQLQSQVKELRDALRDTLNRFQIVTDEHSPDWYDCEADPTVIEARAVLAKTGTAENKAEKIEVEGNRE